MKQTRFAINKHTGTHGRLGRTADGREFTVTSPTIKMGGMTIVSPACLRKHWRLVTLKG